MESIMYSTTCAQPSYPAKDISVYFLWSSQILFFLSFHWLLSYSIWTDGWTDSHHEPDTRFSGVFEVPNRVHFVSHVKYLHGTDLLSSDQKQQCLRIA
jgi:hypothetical protein